MLYSIRSHGELPSAYQPATPIMVSCLSACYPYHRSGSAVGKTHFSLLHGGSLCVCDSLVHSTCTPPTKYLISHTTVLLVLTTHSDICKTEFMSHVHSRSFQLNKWISYNWLLKGTMTLINKQKRLKNLYVFSHPIEIISYLKIDSRLRLKLRVRVVVTMTHEFWACNQIYSMYLREIVY